MTATAKFWRDSPVFRTPKGRNVTVLRRPIVKRWEPRIFAQDLRKMKTKPVVRDHYKLTPKRAVAYIANARRIGTDPVQDMKRDGYSAFLAEKYVALFDDDYRRHSEKARPSVPVGKVVRRHAENSDARF